MTSLTEAQTRCSIDAVQDSLLLQNKQEFKVKEVLTHLS